MIKYLLVLMLNWNSSKATMTSAVVDTKHACEIAGTEWLKEVGSFAYGKYQCVPIKTEQQAP